MKPSAGARRSNHSAQRKEEPAQMPEDRCNRSSQDARACILLAYRPRPLTNIQIISREEKRKKKKVPTWKRTREDGKRKRLRRSGTRSKMETPGRTEPRSGNTRQAGRCLACFHCSLSRLRRFNSTSSIKGGLLLSKCFPRFFDQLEGILLAACVWIEEVLRSRKESVHSRRQPRSSYSTCSCYSSLNHPPL